MKRKGYVLIKHENVIDTDTVEMITLTRDLDVARACLNDAHSVLKNDFQILKDDVDHTRYTDMHHEVLIELIIFEEDLE